MSDNLKDLAKEYDKNVFIAKHPRSIGLFPIPEYPELEPKRGMWSSALEAILTTLRYLAPATLLTLFWGQQSFLFKLLKHIDSAFRAIVFSSEEQKLAVIKWLGEAGSVRVENLETVWRHGWIVCGVLDAALPGACAGHPPTKLSLKHAQSIADHYLGVEPVFSRQELESNGPLSKHQEWKLATYLDRIRQSLTKLTPPVSKPTSQRTSPETTQFTLDYVAKGSGLAAAQVNNKACFKIYPTSQQSLDPGEITILIRGPKDTYGMSVLPPIMGKAQLIRQKLLGLDSKPNYTENVLPITQGATYLRSYGKNDMNKTYHIPKTKYDIEIESETRQDHTKVSYIVKLEGKYDISITSRGQGIVGSPFTATASKNILRVLENDSFCLENGEEIDIVDIKTDRKVVLRIVDFVTEKMLLKENGSLERISDDEAKTLMVTDSNENECECVNDETSTKFLEDYNKIKYRNTKFTKVANKVIVMNRVCKIFNEITSKNKTTKSNQGHNQQRVQQDIPDIVNSTLCENNINPFILTDVRNKYIVPENISVSITTEKSYQTGVIRDNEFAINLTPKDTTLNEMVEDTCPDNNLNVYDNEDDDMLMVISSSPNNPFLVDTYDDNYSRIKDLGTYVTTEYETNNSQNEEIPDSPIKILIEENDTQTEIVNNNPFIEADIIQLERPKTPVYKIISGNVKDRDDSVYVDKKTEQLNEEMMANEFINPFFIHQHHQSNPIKESLPITDFIIGAPVSLPPLIRASSPVPHMESLIITNDDKETKYIADQESPRYKKKIMSNDESSLVFSTPLHTNLMRARDSKTNINSTASSPFHSLDSDMTEDVEIISVSDNQLELSQMEVLEKDLSNIKAKKEIWDSAYVSIDDNNSSPDSNNNDSTQLCETGSKNKFSPNDITFGLKHEDLYNMGPAERELWQTCNELSDVFTIEESKHTKWDTKRPIFTPIIEESDRSISAGMKDNTNSEIFHSKINESDSVTVAFAELNDVYHDYFPHLESESTTTINENNKLHSLEVDFTIKTNDNVDSASEIITDVKRQTNNFEGKISEVQQNVTESVSVSPFLLGHENCEKNSTTEKQLDVQFGDCRTNIVLERKKYWDDRIKQIEAKSQETTVLQKKRKSFKHLRQNDSLTKRRGKQIVKNFLSTGDIDKSPVKIKRNNFENVTNQDTILKSAAVSIEGKENVKLVGKWKKYWDDKLESENNESDDACFKPKSTKCKLQTSSSQYSHGSRISEEGVLDKAPVKQELPEEVYKAFETSPKRFFGTSRKQILNKIDNFLGKPNTENSSSPDITSDNPDSGLVSSRISLFHSITNTEELTWNKHKSKSMCSILIKNTSAGDTDFLEEQLIDELPKDTMKSKVEEDTKTVDHSSEETSKQTIKEKRSRIAYNAFNKSFDETTYHKSNEKLSEMKPQNTYVKNTIKCFNKPDQYVQKSKIANELRRKSFSKSEMDIFNKITHKDSKDDVDKTKYKSCDELPKISVRNFITLYEDVSKSSVESQKSNRVRTISTGPQNIVFSSSHLGAVNKENAEKQYTTTDLKIARAVTISSSPSKRNWINKSFESISTSNDKNKKKSDSIDVEIDHSQDNESTLLSLSDIELEIVENHTDKSSSESSPEREIENVKKDYKSRFKMAKEFFQSLEELRDNKKPRKLNECELLLENKPAERIESQEPRPPKRVKRKLKSHSLPSSEISKVWKQYQEKTESEASTSKLVKISEKFNVDDLFTDVTEGKLSRQGSLRGIPHKKAVLEAFRSMENLTHSKMSPYDTVVSEINNFDKENKIKNAQSYLSEYPYLPTTEPSKYHSRVDAEATGLITLKELLNQRPRRNSVPDLRLNPTFTVNL